MEQLHVIVYMTPAHTLLIHSNLVDSDLLEERPRMRGRRPVSPQPNEEEEEGHQGQPEKSDSATLKVNNNLLADWDGFTDAVHRLFEAPSRLAWVDLSYNDLRTIDKVSCYICTHT